MIRSTKRGAWPRCARRAAMQPPRGTATLDRNAQVVAFASTVSPSPGTAGTSRPLAGSERGSA